jgi:hypothetical protein
MPACDFNVAYMNNFISPSRTEYANDGKQNQAHKKQRHRFLEQDRGQAGEGRLLRSSRDDAESYRTGTRHVGERHCRVWELSLCV